MTGGLGLLLILYSLNCCILRKSGFFKKCLILLKALSPGLYLYDHVLLRVLKGTFSNLIKLSSDDNFLDLLTIVKGILVNSVDVFTYINFCCLLTVLEESFADSCNFVGLAVSLYCFRNDYGFEALAVYIFEEIRYNMGTLWRRLSKSVAFGK